MELTELRPTCARVRALPATYSVTTHSSLAGDGRGGFARLECARGYRLADFGGRFDVAVQGVHDGAGRLLHSFLAALGQGLHGLAALGCRPLQTPWATRVPCRQAG